MNQIEKQPTILDGIVSFTRWSVEQPFYILKTFNFSMYDAVFLIDFGPWKKGDKPYNLIFNVFHGTLTESNNWDECVKTCKLKITAQLESDPS